jgi:hypothetical protein
VLRYNPDLPRSGGNDFQAAMYLFFRLRPVYIGIYSIGACAGIQRCAA